MASPHSRHKRQRDSTAARRALRAKDTRVVRAAKRTADEQAQLDALISLQQAEAQLQAARSAPTWSPEPGIYSAREAARTFEREQRRAELRERFPLSFARQLLRDGYSLEHCVSFTGWDARWFDGVVPGEW